MSVEPVRVHVSVAAPPEDAYATFVERFGSWWPRAATWSGDVLESITIDARPGGLLSEHGPHGLRLDFGRVLRAEPPHRLVFTWQIGPNRAPEPSPARASEVEVTFAATDGGTRVQLEHRALERHGDAADAYRDGMASASGWPHILEAYAASVRRRAEAPWEGLTT